MVGKNYFQRKLAQLANKYDYDSSEYVGCFVWLSGGEKDIFKKEWFDESLSVPFCSGNFLVPKKYDLVQRHAYGDYMQLPPEKERIGHHYYQAYKK